MTPGQLAAAFLDGQSLSAFLRDLPDGGAAFEQWMAEVSPPSDSAFGSPRELNVIAIVETWCRDSMDALPVLARLLQLNPAARLRVFKRDEHMDLMADYLKDGQYAAIPVFLFLDPDFREIGRYVERPDSVAALRRRQREEIARTDPTLGPPDAAPKTFAEPTKTRLKAAIEELRQASRAETNQLIIAALEGVLSPQRTPATAAVPGRTPVLAGAGFPTLQIVDVGDDDCEID